MRQWAMSHEGFTLVIRVLLVASLILVGAFFRALVGPGKRRGEIMLVGTIGGLSVGVFIAYLISLWLTVDISAVSACFGIMLGLAVAWRFARQIPREAN